MKKFLLILSLGCISALALAQPKVPREFQFGAIGGANLSSYTLSPAVTQDKSVGYTGGLGVRYVEEKYFALQCELLLTRRGMKDRYDNYPQYHFERQLTYIEFPAMAHVYFNLKKRSEISLDAGMKLGYYLADATSGNLDSDFDAIAASSTHGYEHHTLAVDQKVDYGIQAGLGYEFKLNKQLSLQIQGRYYFGLGDIFPSTKADTFETSSNQSIQIVMALWFHHRIRPKFVAPSTIEE